MKTSYEAYLRSPTWSAKRLERLNIDNHQCQTCGATENLEIHHKTYARLGHERMSDLITLCQSCHHAITASIRERRFARQQIPPPQGSDSAPVAFVETEAPSVAPAATKAAEGGFC